MTDARRRVAAFFFLAAYFFFGYGVLNRLNMFRDHYFNLALPFEAHIPFVPAFTVGYFFVYVSLLGVYFLSPTWEDFKKPTQQLFWLSTIHYVLFLLIPVKMQRPDLSTMSDGFFLWLTRFFYNIDHPVNCFPSLHVAYPTLATCLIWKKHPRWRVFFLLLSVLTAISVVLIKQHYVLDVVAGALVSLAVFWGI